MANGECICAAVSGLRREAAAHSAAPGRGGNVTPPQLVRVFLYMHYDECQRRLSSNTGKLLQLCLGGEVVKRVVLGQHDQELEMVTGM